MIPLLCEKAKKVISVDADEQLTKKAKSNFSQFDNLTLKSGDGFKKKDSFSIPVARHETLLVECWKVHEKDNSSRKTSHVGRSNG